MNNLGALYLQRGMLSEAETAFRRVLQICEATLGPDHLYTARALNNLGGCLKRQVWHREGAQGAGSGGGGRVRARKCAGVSVTVLLPSGAAGMCRASPMFVPELTRRLVVLTFHRSSPQCLQGKFQESEEMYGRALAQGSDHQANKQHTLRNLRGLYQVLAALRPRALLEAADATTGARRRAMCGRRAGRRPCRRECKR